MKQTDFSCTCLFAALLYWQISNQLHQHWYYTDSDGPSNWNAKISYKKKFLNEWRRLEKQMNNWRKWVFGDKTLGYLRKQICVNVYFLCPWCWRAHMCVRARVCVSIHSVMCWATWGDREHVGADKACRVNIKPNQLHLGSTTAPALSN